MSYLNALPMVYGLQRGPNAALWSVALELPAQSARRLVEGGVDMALMPVGAMHAVQDARIVGGYCVGATGNVYSVCLCAHRPIAELRIVYLDPHSRTSVQLAQILARHYWRVSPQWRVLDFRKLDEGIGDDEGVVLIGDKVFGARGGFEVCYDLASEWIAFTGLPFVFAAWVTRAPMGSMEALALDEDLAWGVARSEEAVHTAGALPCSEGEAIRYLQENIDYPFTASKRQGLQRYLALREELSSAQAIGSRL